MAHLRVANRLGKRGERRDLGFHGRIRGDLRVGGRGTDDDVAALLGDAAQSRDAAQVDDVGGAGQALLEGRQQGHAAAHQLALGSAGQDLDRFLDGTGPMIVEAVHLEPPSGDR